VGHGPAVAAQLGPNHNINLQFTVDILHLYISVRYKNSVGRGSKYLDNLVYIIRVYKRTINTTIEHLEIPLVLIERLSLPLLPLLRQISLTDLVEERHHPPFSTILCEDSCTPIPCITKVTVSISY
jgi:hypothetical protein